MTRTINVGIVGFGWMGQVHAKALTRVLQHYPDLGAAPRLVAVADPADDGRLDYARDVFGIAVTTPDWNELVSRDDIDLVCVAGPNFTHRDVAVAAAKAGKHLWIEKPAGRNLAETRQIADAIAAAGVASAVGFNYRNAPAVELARDLVASGRIGEVRHVRVQMLGDYCAHPDGALTWRFVRDLAGSGVIGDLASHGLDLAQYVVGPIAALIAETSTFIPQRPQAGRRLVAFLARRGRPTAAGRERGPRRRACCGSRPGPAASWRPAAPRSASRTPTASRCTAAPGRSPGTSGGWASCRCASTRTTRAHRGPPTASARATARRERSSRTPRSRSASTTSR